jgi:hypothetical protein
VPAGTEQEIANLESEPINLVAGSKTELFMKQVQVPVHVPLSGRTMEFDGKAK